MIFYMNLKFQDRPYNLQRELLQDYIKKTVKLFEDWTIMRGILKETEQSWVQGQGNGQILNCCRETGQKIKSD